MNAIKANDKYGEFFLCGICGQDFDTKPAASACCSNLVDKAADPSFGRVRAKRNDKPVPFRESMTDPDRGITA